MPSNVRCSSNIPVLPNGKIILEHWHTKRRPKTFLHVSNFFFRMSKKDLGHPNFFPDVQKAPKFRKEFGRSFFCEFLDVRKKATSVFNRPKKSWIFLHILTTEQSQKNFLGRAKHSEAVQAFLDCFSDVQLVVFEVQQILLEVQANVLDAHQKL